MGQGAMTGRGAGFCAGWDRPGFANADWSWGGRGGRGRGGWGGGGRGGFGYRNRYYATGMTGWQRGAVFPPEGVPAWGAPPAAMTREQEIDSMRRQAEYMEGTLADLRKRIDEIESEKS